MAIAKVASLYAGSADGGAFTTASRDTTGATAILVFINDTIGTTATLTDSVGNSYGTPVIAPATSGSVREQVWVKANPTTSATHTWTIAGSAYGPSIGVLALSGTELAAAVDQMNSASGLAVSSIQPGSITPTENNEIVITGFGGINDATAISAPFSPPDGSVPVSATAVSLSIAFEIQTTATARNPTWTIGFSVNVTAWILSIKAAATARRNQLPLLGVG